MATLVTYARPWEMVTESGEKLSGTSVSFLDFYEDSPDGIRPAKISGPRSLYDMLRGHIPCICELSIALKPGKDGKAAPVLNGVEILQEFDLKGLLADG